jgi:hypothetical protein
VYEEKYCRDSMKFLQHQMNISLENVDIRFLFIRTIEFKKKKHTLKWYGLDLLSIKECTHIYSFAMVEGIQEMKFAIIHCKNCIAIAQKEKSIGLQITGQIA